MRLTLKEELKIPAGLSITIDKGIFIVKGPKGELLKKLHNPKISSRIVGDTLLFESKNATRREKKIIKTYIAHLRNMIKGVSQTHSYKLKVCSGHFPMNVGVKGNLFEIKNFLGETIPRTLTIPAGVSIKVEGQFITVEGINKELTGQTAALIEKLTRRPGFDKRIFQDGIFIIEKDGKPVR